MRIYLQIVFWLIRGVGSLVSFHARVHTSIFSSKSIIHHLDDRVSSRSDFMKCVSWESWVMW